MKPDEIQSPIASASQVPAAASAVKQVDELILSPTLDCGATSEEALGDGDATTIAESRPISAIESTWPLDEWPLDVQRVDENGVDLAQIEYQLSLTPADRLRQLEEFADFILTARKRNGVKGWSDTERS